MTRGGVELVLVDEELEPWEAAGRSSEALQEQVLDRRALILDIFATHAVSPEGKLQVELAHSNTCCRAGRATGLEHLDGVGRRRCQPEDPVRPSSRPTAGWLDGGSRSCAGG